MGDNPYTKPSEGATRLTERNQQSVDTILDALADESRRSVIQYLRDTPDGVASREELIEHVAAQSSDAQIREDVKIRLHHTILPRLEEASLLEYDSQSEAVRYQPIPLAEDILASI